MSRIYGEPIEVRAADGRPVRFIWRQRLYTVRVVLEHWVVSREWWQRQNPSADVPPEREFWRVEASPGQDVPSAVYELRRDTESGDWLLSRIWDLRWPERPERPETAGQPGQPERPRRSAGRAGRHELGSGLRSPARRVVVFDAVRHG